MTYTIETMPDGTFRIVNIQTGVVAGTYRSFRDVIRAATEWNRRERRRRVLAH